MHDPSSRACASYFLAGYKAQQARTQVDALPMTDAEFDQHVESLAGLIQQTVETYLRSIVPTLRGLPSAE